VHRVILRQYSSIGAPNKKKSAKYNLLNYSSVWIAYWRRGHWYANIYWYRGHFGCSGFSGRYGFQVISGYPVVSAFRSFCFPVFSAYRSFRSLQNKQNKEIKKRKVHRTIWCAYWKLPINSALQSGDGNTILMYNSNIEK